MKKLWTNDWNVPGRVYVFERGSSGPGNQGDKDKDYWISLGLVLVVKEFNNVWRWTDEDLGEKK